MSKLLIVGGTGFFGKSILDAFQRGVLVNFRIDCITIISRNKQRFLDNYSHLVSDKIEIIEADITKMNFLPKAEIIIYAAASTNIEDYKKNGVEEFQKMKASILNFCKLVKEMSNTSQIVFCSSGAVYGKQQIDIEKIDESQPLTNELYNVSQDKKWYILGKRFGEESIKNLAKLDLNVVIARCFAFSGKYLPKDQHYALGNFIGEAEKGNNIIVNAPGIVFRSYMDADDLVKSLLVLSHIASPNCPVFNVGSDHQISLYDLAESIALKYNVSVEYNNLNKNIVIDRYVPNTDKLKNLLNEYNFN